MKEISYGTIAQSATDQQIVGNADNQHAQLVEDGPPAEHYDQAVYEGLACRLSGCDPQYFCRQMKNGLNGFLMSYESLGRLS